MPICQGFVGTQAVKVLRDTGCSGVVVKKSLVTPKQYIGRTQRCIFIDGSVHAFPMAEIYLDAPFFTGHVSAVVIEKPLYPLIVGNIKGVDDKSLSVPKPLPDDKDTQVDFTPLQAVVTRSKAKSQIVSDPKPLKVVPGHGLNVQKAEVIKFQEADETLRKCFVWSEQKKKFSSDKGSLYWFSLEDGLLLRNFQSPSVHFGERVSQVVLPKCLREKVLSLAHCGLLAGHQGSKKTLDRVLSNFYWPGVHADVGRYCQSCDICQRTIAKGKVANVSLEKMPIVGIPFERVAVDLIGPITPASERGQWYILSIVDYATRYPEAVALKKISTEEVAEALVGVFSRVGIPKEILSDRGTQFTSDLMHEIGRLLSLKQLTTTPYHPICNGLVEKFNGTLKNMVKKLCEEKPKDWDRYLVPLLFAYREVPQAALAFSPFELLYGRTIRGPMSVLKDLWTDEQTSSDVKLSYQYVLELRQRLEETISLAQDQLKQKQNVYKHYYDRKTRSRNFKQGDSVLLLLPTSSNKLLMQWKGPFVVLEKLGVNDYKVQLPSGPKVFHANLLKLYHSRSEITGNLEVMPVSFWVIEHDEDEVEGCELPILEQTENVKDVVINPRLKDSQKHQLENLLQQYSDIFSDVPKVTNLLEHSIPLTTDEPVISKPYPVPLSMKNVIRKEIDKMLKLGVIEPSTASYASPVVLVRKKDNTVRFCIDYRKVNKCCYFDPMPTPMPDVLYSKLSESSVFSKCDLSKGYWQIPIKREDRDITTFVTPDYGMYWFKVVPFGLVTSAASCNRLMNILLKDLRGFGKLCR